MLLQDQCEGNGNIPLQEEGRGKQQCFKDHERRREEKLANTCITAINPLKRIHPSQFKDINKGDGTLFPTIPVVDQ
jgi:hypothetical protein